MSNTAVAQVLDTSGELCPLPVIKTKLAMDKLAPGQVVQLIATDPGSKSDLPSWANSTGNSILEAREEQGKFVFLIQKT
ncbi:MAG: sulfurtransferase TusA family protein [Chloroflexi bacterium]|nr:sulfurtransferase TusA family protein [Chloroflexota bacterium]